MNARPYELIRTNPEFGILPIPSVRTLNRHIEHVVFRPGVLEEGIKWLGVQVRADPDPSVRLCIISGDEMSVRPAVEYDKALDCYLGLVSPEIARSLEEAQTKADHVFALVARGLTTHWKAVVGSVFTGLSTDKYKLWAFIVEAMRHLKREEISTVGYSSDMGPCNTALWSLNGVYANESGVVTSHPHPVEEGKRLYFLPDVSHVMKNIWCQLLRCISFCLPTRSRRTPSPATRFRWNTSGSFTFVRRQKVEPRLCQN